MSLPISELAAELQNRIIADVVTAIPMTRAQEDRLRAILAWRIGTDVELNTTIDPSVIGGVKVSVRDDDAVLVLQIILIYVRQI